MLTKQSTYEGYLQANKAVTGTVGLKDLNTSKSDYESALAAYMAAKAAAFIQAPIAGKASDTDLAVGSSVQQGDVLLTIINQQSLQLKYTLPGQYSNQAKTGQAVTFTPSDATQSYAASVVYVSPQLNVTTDNLTLRANFNAESNLPPNVFGKITQVLDAHHQALVVLQTLVQSDEQGFYVYVVASGKVAKQYIQLGNITQKGYIEVKSGISATTPMIVSDASALSVGQNVKVKAP